MNGRMRESALNETRYSLIRSRFRFPSLINYFYLNLNERPAFVKKWFDKECKELKKMATHELRAYKRSNFIEKHKSAYLEARKKYLKTCNDKKKNYQLEILKNINNARNSTDFWKAIRAYHAKTTTPTSLINLQKWQEYYAELLPPSQQNLTSYVGITHPMLDADITLKELNKALKTSARNKAAGVDEITNEFYQALPQNWKLLLLTLFNKVNIDTYKKQLHESINSRAMNSHYLQAPIRNRELNNYYLKCNIPLSMKKLIAQIRCATNFGVVIYANKFDPTKNCPSCSVACADTLEHFFCSCPKFKEIRKHLNFIKSHDELTLSNVALPCRPSQIKAIYSFTNTALKIRLLEPSQIDVNF
ncbi:hypothetical protein KQX54_017868 [Cotesia glomerata]|uniref:Uncharacterized protein n=1 Tax=Cotesia glomerata TaxID=32391 RepID=A0AAV7IGN6_COTGL|nr:hypothetical protein KQX54_017868 [Cotesia glomerata]